MSYVVGVDLGTSAVKVLLMNRKGNVVAEYSESYPLIQVKSGYSEQDPEQWVEKTTNVLSQLVKENPEEAAKIEGISFSGQMHGLVLLNESHEVIRPAILWNDTRTTKQCQDIYNIVGKEQVLSLTKNPALEGFTLPKILWVKENEPENLAETAVFLLPKDYLRFRLTGQLHSEYSDAAGTLLLDIQKKEWSSEIAKKLDIDLAICPPLVESHECVGTITADFAFDSGLPQSTKVFAGGADNACGAIGSGILAEGKTMCSIGTSGVVLSYEDNGEKEFGGKVHYFNHGQENTFYTMGVTLTAGHSLSWFKDVFAKDEPFEQLTANIDQVPPGANGLLFTPYLGGERTPHADSSIRASFIGMDASHKRVDFVRAVLEGITFSLNESIELFRDAGKQIDTVLSIGGGAKNETWLQMQADIFNTKVERLETEQGPGVGAAMLAAYGCGWYDKLADCADEWLEVKQTYEPNQERVEAYKQLFAIYQSVYTQTKTLNEQLVSFRK
ncbi:xylulokinase [Halalkalibacter hemicellulosilyticus]|uniref:Xylulose kinase n=1 Tax=Halalkalibacter hemicellulosilyticusJCM 9152 TaxID=1236971 RepID=W4QGE4_9BACI|nr:xylulokinase [Halalkalibacter hemicellulosilyticus]GAE30977.1 xylulose kinase [Halalkalibacter hemicellulosilyticusJCM 9152]